MANCFVMMPFGGFFDSYYQHVFKPAIADAGLKPVRADEIFSASSVMSDIYRGIEMSKICLADVTGKNPNVSYELGMAHCLNKPVLIATQSIDDVPFDYRHLRIIHYNPVEIGWQDKFKSVVAATVKEVLRDPEAHIVLPSQRKELKVTRNHLTNVFYAIEAYLSVTDDIYYSGDGDARIETKWEFKAFSPIFHFCHNIVIEKPGNIIVKSAQDYLNGRSLEVVEVESGESHLSYMVLLKQFKKAGQSFEAVTVVEAENYLYGLEQKKTVRMAMQATQRSGIKYDRKIERYHFPLRPPFDNLHSIYKNHPDPTLVGSRINAHQTGGEYLLELRYETTGAYAEEVGSMISV